MEIAKQLHDQISSVCPIDGVSIGRKDDKLTWRIDFKSEATQEQRNAARAVVDTFDVATAEMTRDRMAIRDRKVANLAEILISKGIITEDDLK